MIEKLSKLSESVEKRLKRKSALGNTIQLMIRYSDRKTITRRMKVSHFIEKAQDILYYCELLLEEHWNGEPIRLLGITIQNAVPKEDLTYQLDLFRYLEEK